MLSELPFVYWLIAFVVGSLAIGASMILKTRNPFTARVGFLIVLFDLCVVTLAFGGLFDGELIWRIPRSDFVHGTEPQYLIVVRNLLLFSPYLILLCYSWWKLRSEGIGSTRGWRTVSGFLALTLATVSFMLYATTEIYEAQEGGFPDILASGLDRLTPFVAIFLFSGYCLSVAALVLAVFGTGWRRTNSLILSLSTIPFWCALAIAADGHLMSGKGHSGDKPAAYSTERGFDEIKNFAPSHANSDTSSSLHPWFPSPNPAPAFPGKPQLGKYLDPFMEMDAYISLLTNETHTEVPNIITGVTADNGAWLDTYPDAVTIPFGAEEGSADEGGWRAPGIMSGPEQSPAGQQENLTAGGVYNLNTDPYEEYHMMFNGAAPGSAMTTSPGSYSGQDNGWVKPLVSPVQHESSQSIIDYPGIRRFPRGTDFNTKSRESLRPGTHVCESLRPSTHVRERNKDEALAELSRAHTKKRGRSAPIQLQIPAAVIAARSSLRAGSRCPPQVRVAKGCSLSRDSAGLCGRGPNPV
jgi:hypothetical protein